MEAGQAAGEQEITLRPLERDDAEGLALLLARYGDALRHAREPSAPDVAAAARLLADPVAEILGAFVHGQPVAFAVFFDLPEAISGQRAGQLDDLFVMPEMRGRRLAERLIQAVAAEGLARGWVQLRWLAPQDNDGARRAYERFAEAAPWASYVLWLGDGARW
ncbi:GNAT family N-acetyltransferase [Xanthobacter variabilis]